MTSAQFNALSFDEKLLLVEPQAPVVAYFITRYLPHPKRKSVCPAQFFCRTGL